MPQPIYMPQQQGGMDKMMPYIMQMMQMYSRQKFAGEQKQEERDYATETLEKRKATKPNIPGIYWSGTDWKQARAQVDKPYKLSEQGLIYTDAQGKLQVDTKFKSDPKMTTTTKTDEAGNVTIIGTDKKTGEVKYKRSLGKIGKPGKSGVNVHIGQEKLKLQKGAFLGNLRLEITNANNEETYRAKAPQYNRENTSNEVLYWDTKLMDEVKSVKIPKGKLKEGWTPAKIQEAAERNAISVEKVLKREGIIK